MIPPARVRLVDRIRIMAVCSCALMSTLVTAESVLLMADQSMSYQRFLMDLYEASEGVSQAPTQNPWPLYLINPNPPSAIYEMALQGHSMTVTLIDSDQPDARVLNPSLGDDQRFKVLCEQTEVIVALGQVSAQLSQQQCPKPTLLALLTRDQAQPLLAESKRPQSAIYLEVDPILNLRLIRRALAQASTVGILLQPQHTALMSRLKTEATRLGLRLIPLYADNDSAAIARLREAITALDAMLLLPETRLVNDWSLKPLLLMTVRHQVPVFGGLSVHYVSAGVTAAVLPDVLALQTQIKTMVDQLAAGDVPPPAYPSKTQVIYNKVMVRSFALQPDRLTDVQ